MTNSSTGRAVISKIPRERVLTETDGPYVEVARRAAVPSDVRAVVSFLATLWRTSATDAEAGVFSNYERAAGIELGEKPIR